MFWASCCTCNKGKADQQGSISSLAGEPEKPHAKSGHGEEGKHTKHIYFHMNEQRAGQQTNRASHLSGAASDRGLAWAA